MKKNSSCKILAFALAIALCFSTAATDTYAFAAKKATLKNKTLTLVEGSKQTISIKNKNKKNTYKFTSSKTKIATVSSKGQISAKKVGTTTITVKETYKKGSKKVTRKVGSIAVKVKAKPQPTIATTAIPTLAPTPTTAPVATPTVKPATAAPTKIPVKPTATPLVDETDGIAMNGLSVKETFDSSDVVNVPTSSGTLNYVPTGGAVTADGTVVSGNAQGAGYAQVAKDPYNGPVVFIDNRKGTANKEVYLSAYIRATDPESLNRSVVFWGGNTYENSAYFDSSYIYKGPATRKLTNKWEQIKAVLSVPAGKFIEIRVKSDYANFDIDQLVLKEKEVSDNVTMAPLPTYVPADPQPIADFTVSQIKVTGDATLSGGVYTLPTGWKYMFVELPKETDMSKFTNMTIAGSVDGAFRYSFFDQYMDNLKGYDEYTYVGAFDAATGFNATLGFEGYAKYLCIGSKSDADLKVALTSISLKLTAEAPAQQ